MTDRSAIAQIIRRTRPSHQPARPAAGDAGRLRVNIALPGAKVFLLPGRFRDAAYVKRHVAFVLTRDAEQGERHVQRNLKAIRHTLEEIGIDGAAINAELRTIEAAVRAEIWKQVMLPGEQA